MESVKKTAIIVNNNTVQSIAAKRLDRLLFLHVILSCLSGMVLLGACTGGAFFWGYSRRRLKQGLQRAFRRYPDERIVRLRVDKLQMELHCCGVESYRDWFYLPWENVKNEGIVEFQDENETQEEYEMDYPDARKLVRF